MLLAWPCSSAPAISTASNAACPWWYSAEACRARKHRTINAPLFVPCYSPNPRRTEFPYYYQNWNDWYYSASVKSLAVCDRSSRAWSFGGCSRTQWCCQSLSVLCFRFVIWSGQTLSRCFQVSSYRRPYQFREASEGIGIFWAWALPGASFPCSSEAYCRTHHDPLGTVSSDLWSRKIICRANGPKTDSNQIRH